MPIQSVEKNLGGAEDLLLGAGTINQSRNGQIVVISKINATKIPYSGDVSTANFISIKSKIDADKAELDAINLAYQADDDAIIASLNLPTIVRKSSDVGVVYLPSGTTAQRPVLANGIKGIRYNTDLLIFESGIGTVGPTTWTGLQFLLESGTNIKSINGSSLLGSGNMEILSTVSGVRQTVQNALMDANGYPIFATIGTGLSVNIAATAVPIVVHLAGGKISDDELAILVADTTISVPANFTSYIYVDKDITTGAITLGSTILPPNYQFGGTPSVVANQHTYNYAEGKMYVGNPGGTASVWVKRTFIMECTTNATNVTSVVNYALNGKYDSGYTATLPSATASVSKNHNIGTNILKCYIEAECTTIDAGFAVGDIFEDISCYGSSYPMKLPIIRSRNIMKFKTGDGGGWYIINQTSGSLAAATLASWKYKLIAQRGF